MASVESEEVIDCDNTKLDLYTNVDGFSVDVAELAFAIFESDGTTVLQARTTLDPTTDCPTGSRLETGHYSLGPTGWTVPQGQAVGTYKITWFFKLTSSSPESTFTEEFEVVSDVGAATGGYALVSDFRDEGFTEAEVSDARLLTLITRMSRQIDSLTRQWFEPRTGTMVLDGSGTNSLRFSVPIISITEVRVDDTVLDNSSFKVYNRHLSGVYVPDDRGDPRISFYKDTALPYSTSNWRVGRQNIEVDGVFGYTDGPGPSGTTPLDIKEACMLMVAKKIPLMSDREARLDARRENFVSSIKTRDQAIAWNVGEQQKAQSNGGYSLTGDSEIDQLLIPLMRSIVIGSTSGGFDVRDYRSHDGDIL